MPKSSDFHKRGKGDLMKVGIVVAGYLDRPGGVERCVVTIINTLNEKGYEIYLCCLQNPDLRQIKMFFGKEIKLDKVYTPSSLWSYFPYVHVFGRFLLVKAFMKMAHNVEMIIDLDGGFLHNFLPSKFLPRNYIIYRLSMPPVPSMLELEEPLLYKILRKFLVRSMRKLMRLPQKHTIFSVNRYTGKLLWNVWNIKINGILYPPINTTVYRKNSKKNQIVCIGRFSPEKKFEVSINLIHEILKSRKDVILYLLGSTYHEKTSQNYISHLQKDVAKKKLQNYVKIITNIDITTMRNILAESKIILSSQVIPDSFDISIIEGMASGCIPVVPKVKGAWEEIVEKGKYGFGFDNLEECCSIVISILNDDELSREYSIKAAMRAQYFSENTFKEKFLNVIETLNMK